MPLAGSTITAYAGSATAASPIGSGISDTNGNFSFAIDELGGDAVLYAIARGGSIAGVPNPAIGLMTVLGIGSEQVSSIRVNELTTVAAVWSLAQFIHSGAAIFGPSPGLQNAAATAPTLVDPESGTAAPDLVTTGANKVDSIANILAGCISNGSKSRQCTNLFRYTAVHGLPHPSDTLAASWNLARHPSLHVSDLYRLSLQSSRFFPTLPFEPAAWTVSIQFYGGGLAAPVALAIDSSGNVWVANAYAVGAISEFLANGTPAAGSPFLCAGRSNFESIAIDTAGNIWAPTSIPGAYLCEFNAFGDLISPSTGYPIPFEFESPAIADIAADQSGNIWMTDFQNNSLIEMSSQGQALSPVRGFRSEGMLTPIGVAIDANGDAWVTSDGGDVGPPTPTGSVFKFDPQGTPLSGPKGWTAGGIRSPTGVAIDLSSHVWVADTGGFYDDRFNDGITKLTLKGTPLSPRKGFQGGGLSIPSLIAIDGAGNAWIINNNQVNSNFPWPLTVLDPNGHPISPRVGYCFDGYLDSLGGIAIDPSGNVWTTNSGINTLQKMVGAAAPIRTPLISSLISPLL